jgi:translation initiation factor 2B subunit (eIF-2B alpha/beta/delta family)
VHPRHYRFGALKMVLPAGLKRSVSRIREDNIHGSIDIALECCRLFLYNESADSDTLKEVAMSLLEAQGSMAVVVNLVNQLLYCIDEEGDIRDTTEHYIDHIVTSLDRIAENTLPLMENKETIITHSSGATVRRALLHAIDKGMKPRVVCTESRPIYEGRKLAEDLSDAGLDVTLVVDAAIFQEIEEADLVLLGADSISIQGLVNKIGTKGVSQVARNLRKDIYVLAGTDKVMPLGVRPYEKDLRSPGEIYKGDHDLDVRNYYFDLTSMGLMDGLVTEDGVYDIYQLMELIDRNVAHPKLKEQMKGR